MEHNDKKNIAALMLARGIRGADLAKVIGVAPETISRWKAQEPFQALVHQLRQEIVEVAQAELQAQTSAAVAVLTELMQNSTDSIRLKAAGELLRLASINDSRNYGAGIRFGEAAPEHERLYFGL
jgi:transcriptional regulator with XRE-family HTH domain